MVEVDLHISKRLQSLLPPLTPEEREQLKANILADGRVTDPILYWHDGKRNVVVDGMHRFDIARRENTPYRTEPIELGATYDDAKLWILNRQLGRRNLLSPAAQRTLRGELYNLLKRIDGGHGDQRSGYQIDTPIQNAAIHVAEIAGVAPITVKRDGARMEALERCSPAIQKGIQAGAFKVPDTADLKILATLTPEDQSAVALVLRKGQAQCVKTAMEKANVKHPAPKRKATAKPDYGKCPNCAGGKWTEGEEGVVCSKCSHPHGEPAGDTDEDRLKTQRQKTIKTVEAAVRAFDDLQLMRARAEHDEAVTGCKRLLAIAKGWK